MQKLFFHLARLSRLNANVRQNVTKLGPQNQKKMDQLVAGRRFHQTVALTSSAKRTTFNFADAKLRFQNLVRIFALQRSIFVR
jgi:hypothetical protein